MKKILIMFVLGIFLVGCISAMDWDNKKEYKTEVKTLNKYGKYEIYDSGFLGIGKGDKLVELILKDNSEFCDTNCFAIQNITLENDGSLIDGVRFYELVYNPFLNSNVKRATNIDYELYVMEKGKWKKYKEKETYTAGNYEVKLVGTKSLYKKIDWQIKVQGIWTEEWAVWNTFTNGLTQENITFSGRETYIRNLSIPSTAFLTSANITLKGYQDGSSNYPTNASLYINGSYAWNGTGGYLRSYPTDNLISYWTFDETSGEIIDLNDVANLTNNGATTGVDGKVNTAYKLVKEDFDTIIFPNNYSKSNQTGSLSFWFNGTLVNNVTGIQKLFYRSGFNGYIKIIVTVTDKIEIEWQGDAVDGNVTLLNNTWNHIVVSSTGNNWELWVNGKNNSLTPIAGSNSGKWFGDLSGDSIGNFGHDESLDINSSFQIDEVGYWDDVLTPSEVNQLYNLSYGYEFQSSENLNVADTLNTILSSCTAVNGNCAIPFNFTSTNGVLGYSALLLTNENYIENSQSYNSTTYETKREGFSINISYDPSYYTSSSANLVYNGTEYTTTKTNDGNNFIFTKTIDIPLLSVNQETKSFYWKISLTNSTGTYISNSSEVNQTLNKIILMLCNATYDQSALNFTVYDEITDTIIDSVNNPITYETSFYYWVGSGNIYKNYSYQNLSSSMNSFSFCIGPTNQSLSFKSDMESSYSASNYNSNNYYINNATLTNTTSNIKLYLLNSSDSTKFYITVYQGVSAMEGATITIAKYFVGEGNYKTVSIKETDSDGEFIINLEEDENYQFTVTKNGILYKVVEKTASCSVTPCEMTLQVDGEQGNIFQAYEDYFASNILSNVSYDKDTSLLTYSFIDITGLANYFRLTVQKVSLNNTNNFICDKSTSSTSGTLTCNMSGNDGDFIAKSYVSRSPEKLDKTYSFIISTLQENLGVLGALFSLGIILAIVFSVAAITKGNPSAIILSFGFAILILKFMTILPFSWVTVSVIELGCFYLARLTKT